MPQPEVTIPCHQCGEQFNPYLNKKKGWTCPNCKTRQPNLALHYRIIAYICGAALLGTSLAIASSIMRVGHLASNHWVPIAQGLLLLVALTAITFAREPWRSNGLTSLLSLLFLSFFFFYLVGPILLLFALEVKPHADMTIFLVGFGIISVAVGSYLLWVYLSVRRIHLTARE